ncbi:hypothetical protein ACLOJK_037990 [Asimina triloba]
MADALVSIALEKLAHILGRQLTLFAGAKDELRRLQQTFQYIKAVIDDAESKQVTQESVRVWLVDLKQVAYDIDDLLEDVLEKNRSNVDVDDAVNRVSHCASACLPSPYTCLDWPVSRYKLARDIQEIRKSSYAKEVMIGRDDDIKTLKSALVCGSGSSSSSGYDQQQVQVISIVGIGGLGKTTLARTIYNDGEVRGHFKDALYWVCVSEDFDSERVTKAIIEQVKGASTSLSQLDSLQNELVKGLRGKRFLLILDDVWNEDKQNGILVTTRALKVAKNITNITYIHDLKGLSDDDSWELFRSIAFDGRTTEECSQLESVGREIVSKCKGVPLSIRVMGSMMNSKRTEADWQNILNSKIWSLREAETRLLPVLLLSYYNLPPYLKLLGAEEEYVGRIVGSTRLRGVIRCKMHDLLHDLAEFIAKDEIYSEQCSSRSNVRHAFFSFTDTDASFPRAKNLHTLFVNRVVDGSESVIADLLHQARFLRALVFGGSTPNERIAKLPNAIGKIKHLRIEGLARVPSREEAEKAQLRNKPHLRSLDLSMGGIGIRRENSIITTERMESVSEGLRPHANLEELILDSHGFGVLKLPSWVEGMPCLSKLNLRNCLILDRLPHLPSLKEFRISGSESVTLPDGGWERLSLETLEINFCEKLESLPEGLGYLKKLKSLKIEYLKMLTHLPDSLGQLQSLETLQIYYCEKLESLPDGLGQLKKLKSLTIKGQLESLESLDIYSCEKLGSLPHSFGQLEVLGWLLIWDCNALGSLPHGLQHLSHLQTLWIEYCPLLSERCKREGGADWSKISHVPNIYIDA